MNELIIFFIFCQAFGAFIGALTAVWGEAAYIHAIQDGEITKAEHAHLSVITRGLRYGMSLLLVSSFALVVVSYSLHGTLQPAMTASYWIFISLALLIIGISWALARRRIPFTIGSAAAITAWWILTYLSAGQLVLSYGAAVASFVVLTVIVYAVLQFVFLISPHLSLRGK